MSDDKRTSTLTKGGGLAAVAIAVAAAGELPPELLAYLDKAKPSAIAVALVVIIALLLELRREVLAGAKKQGELEARVAELEKSPPRRAARA